MIELGLVIQTLVWFMLSAIFLTRRDATIFHPVSIFLAFHGLVFVLRPWLVYIFDFTMVWDYMRFHPTESEFIFTLALSTVGMLVFYIFAVTWGRSVPFVGKTEQLFTNVERHAFFLTALLISPMALYSIWQTIQGFEGEHVNGTYILKNTTGYILDAQQMLVPVSFLLILLYRKWWAYLPIALFLSYRVYFGWARWTIVLTLLMLLLGYLWTHRQKWPRLRMLLLLPLVWAVFSSLGLDRSAVKRFVGGQDNLGSLMENSQKAMVTYDTLDFANFDYLTYVHGVVPEKTGTYTYGTQYLQLFTEPIPRMLWEGKPVGAPITFFNLGDYGNFLGLTISVIGDGWISGGWIGLVLSMAIWGVILGKFHAWFWRNQNDSTKVFLYIIVHAEILQHFRDGGISIFKFMLFTTAPVFLWRLMISVSSKLHSVRPAKPRVQHGRSI